MSTFVQACSFFSDNPELLIEFVLTQLNNLYRLKLFAALRDYLSNNYLLPRVSFDSNDTYGRYFCFYHKIITS